MTLTAFEAYEKYHAIKLHFKQHSYDYFKYSGKSRLKESNFDISPHKTFALKLAKHKDIETFILANVLEDPDIFIKELAYDEGCEKRYINFLKRKESLTYLFQQELDKIDDIKKAIKVISGQHPQLFRLYLKGEISLDTIAMIIDIVGIFDIWDHKMDWDVVWINESQKIKKYIPWLPQEKSKFKQIVVAKLRQ